MTKDKDKGASKDSTFFNQGKGPRGRGGTGSKWVPKKSVGTTSVAVTSEETKDNGRGGKHAGKGKTSKGFAKFSGKKGEDKGKDKGKGRTKNKGKVEVPIEPDDTKPDTTRKVHLSLDEIIEFEKEDKCANLEEKGSNHINIDNGKSTEGMALAGAKKKRKRKASVEGTNQHARKSDFLKFRQYLKEQAKEAKLKLDDVEMLPAEAPTSPDAKDNDNKSNDNKSDNSGSNKSRSRPSRSSRSSSSATEEEVAPGEEPEGTAFGEPIERAPAEAKEKVKDAVAKTTTSTQTEVPTAAMKNNNFSNLVLSMGQEANVLIIAEKMVNAATNGELTQLGLVQYAHSLTSLVTTVVDLK